MTPVLVRETLDPAEAPSSLAALDSRAEAAPA